MQKLKIFYGSVYDIQVGVNEILSQGCEIISTNFNVNSKSGVKYLVVVYK